MKIAFVFPGQGSQSVGMLGSVAQLGAVRAVLERASGALHEDLAALIEAGPAEVLARTVNTQPCMLVAGYAFYAAWCAAGGRRPVLLAGHSLGEYTALAAAEALDFDAAVRLVRFRAEAMQRAVPLGTGTMAAILGLSDEQVLAVCAEAMQAAPVRNGALAVDADADAAEIVEAVNFNAPSQVVIAGHAAAVARACTLALAHGARRAVLLDVSAPFHSSLQRPASDALRQRLAGETIAVPRVPVINNVDVAIESDPQRIRDALARQAARPVRWVEVIRRMAAEGITDVVECGPGRVLAGLTRRIAPQLASHAVFDRASLEQTLERLGEDREGRDSMPEPQTRRSVP